MKNDNEIIDVAIIGGGPAGLTSAIYASRADLKTVIFEKSAPGGKLNNTHKIDNYPGMDGKAGWEFAMSFKNHAEHHGANIIGGDVVEITNLESKTNKILKLSNGNEYKAKTIIIATGQEPMKIDVPGYDEYFGKGVSTCIVCDGAFFRNKSVAVIGGGNAATEESLFGKKIVDKIFIVNEFPSFRAEKATIKKISESDNIEVNHNTKITEIIGNGEKVTSIKVINNGEERVIEVAGVFSYVGWLAENYFIKEKYRDIVLPNGMIDVNNNLETKYSGVYAIGDIAPKEFKQLTTATSDGTRAALQAEKYIDNL